MPLVIKDNTILFGITEPENILFIGGLNDRFPQYRFKALFIPFSDYQNIFKKIYDSFTEPAGMPEEKPVDLSLLLSFKTSIEFSLKKTGNRVRIVAFPNKM